MFAVIGEALLDMVQPEPAGPYVARPGGGPLNIAVGLCRLGHPTALLARISDGALGDLIRRHAITNDVDLSYAVSAAEQATLAFATLDELGRASYDFYVRGTADWGWTREELSSLPTGTRVVHTGSLAAAMAPGADHIASTMEGLRRAGGLMLSFDPNIRPALAGPRERAVQRIERYVATSHLVKASDEDVGWLYPGAAPHDVLRRWLDLGAELVVLTRGLAGCIAVKAGDDPVEVPAHDVTMVDTIGAGDAFQSGLLSGLVDAGCRSAGELTALPRSVLLSVLERATLVSGLTCERAGADPPKRTVYDADVRRRAPSRTDRSQGFADTESGRGRPEGQR